MKRGSRLRWGLAFLFAAVFLFSTAMAVRIVAEGRKEQKAFEELAALVAGARSEADSAETASGNRGASQGNIAAEETAEANQNNYAADESAVSYEKTENTNACWPYAALLAQNPDFFGWVSIADTTLNYPVMFTPDRPEYYLRRAFDGSSSQSGVPFLDESCFTEGGNYLVYGHNMKNGTMFSTLLSYKDAQFWREHPLIQFDTCTEMGYYRVMAAFYVSVSPEDTDFLYYQYTDLRDPSRYAEYLQQVQALALYDTGVTAEFGNQLLTLSTCSDQTENVRFVVVARKEPD